MITNPMSGASSKVKKSIIKGQCYEEKGTDVNLAAKLLIDLYEDDFDTALIISNDTDFKMAVSQVKAKNKRIFVVNTKVGELPQIDLRGASHQSKRKITEEKLQNSQFPELVTSNIRKPKEWE